jgi:FkbH-like protein
MTPADPRSRWRQYRAEPGDGADKPELAVALAGSITVEPLEPYLGAYLLSRTIRPRITVGPFNQLPQICFNHSRLLGAVDVIILIWRVEDLFPEMLGRAIQDPQAMSSLLEEVRGLADAVAHLGHTFGGTVIVSSPPYPTYPGFELADIRQGLCGMRVFQAISQLWSERVGRMERVRLFDLHGLVLEIGVRQAHDVRKWQLYRQPYTERLWHDAGRTLGRMIAAERVSPKKAVVLDLDNTLWGGIVGEDRLEGLELGDDFPGRAYRDFQRYLKHLKNQGVFLAVASKNNVEDAMEVFERHDAMILSREDIAAFEIHWDSKVESIKRIASRLNIGLDALVFVDDSAKEIGEVRERLPEVTCVIVPEELAELPALLANTEFFDMIEVTDEDRHRTEMVVADSLRQDIREGLSEEEFRQSLQLKVSVFAAGRQHLARVTQLINKSNQFNLTTIRRTQAEVEALSSAANALVMAMNISDKYGDYGLVGVGILRKEEHLCIIDTLLMSCRVLGRGAEETFIAKLAEAAQALDCTEMRGKYVPTRKNAMVADLYRRFGFEYQPASDEWLLALTVLPSPPPYVEATLDLSARLAAQPSR